MAALVTEREQSLYAGLIYVHRGAHMEPTRCALAFNLDSLSMAMRPRARDFCTHVAEEAIRRSSPLDRHSVVYFKHICHTHVLRNSLACVLVSGSDYPQRLALLLVDKVLRLYMKSPEGKRWRTITEDRSVEFDKMLEIIQTPSYRLLAEMLPGSAEEDYVQTALPQSSGPSLWGSLWCLPQCGSGDGQPRKAMATPGSQGENQYTRFEEDHESPSIDERSVSDEPRATPKWQHLVGGSEDEMSEVLSNLFVSNCVLARDKECLSRMQIQVIVDVTEPVDQVPPFTELPTHLIYNNFPLKDNPQSDFSLPARLEQHIIQCIHVHRQLGRKVLLHCRAGVNRSITVACAYIMWWWRCSKQTAQEHLRQVRRSGSSVCKYDDELSRYEDQLMLRSYERAQPLWFLIFWKG
mmetsp:Transcript_18477/g.55448  ORF Transcript_18477/g.55448 Transcript_18477/m.55448 type:complete len:408 (-) Transcript_18477:18-1241(-)